MTQCPKPQGEVNACSPRAKGQSQQEEETDTEGNVRSNPFGKDIAQCAVSHNIVEMSALTHLAKILPIAQLPPTFSLSIYGVTMSQSNNITMSQWKY